MAEQDLAEIFHGSARCGLEGVVVVHPVRFHDLEREIRGVPEPCPVRVDELGDRRDDVGCHDGLSRPIHREPLGFCGRGEPAAGEAFPCRPRPREHLGEEREGDDLGGMPDGALGIEERARGDAEEEHVPERRKHEMAGYVTRHGDDESPVQPVHGRLIGEEREVEPYRGAVGVGLRLERDHARDAPPDHACEESPHEGHLPPHKAERLHSESACEHPEHPGAQVPRGGRELGVRGRRQGGSPG